MSSRSHRNELPAPRLRDRSPICVRPLRFAPDLCRGGVGRTCSVWDIERAAARNPWGFLELLRDVKELAAYLHVPVSTVYDSRTRGFGPRAYRFGKTSASPPHVRDPRGCGVWASGQCMLRAPCYSSSPALLSTSVVVRCGCRARASTACGSRVVASSMSSRCSAGMSRSRKWSLDRTGRPARIWTAYREMCGGLPPPAHGRGASEAAARASAPRRSLMMFDRVANPAGSQDAAPRPCSARCRFGGAAE